MVHYPDPGPGDADLSFTLTKPQLLGISTGGGPDGVEHEGDPGALQRLLSVLETPLPPSRSSRHSEPPSSLAVHRSQGEARQVRA